MNQFPIELKIEVLKHLPFQKLVTISHSFALMLFDKSKHTWEWAAEGGYISVFKFLQKYNDIEYTPIAMDIAAAEGHFTAVKWLHINDKTCTYRAMDWAAQNGQLEIIEFLNLYRNEGCTTLAMDRAAEHNHMHVVMWLHDNRQEGCTSYAWEFASRNGYTDMVMWIHNNYRLAPPSILTRIN